MDLEKISPTLLLPEVQLLLIFIYQGIFRKKKNLIKALTYNGNEKDDSILADHLYISWGSLHA